MARFDQKAGWAVVGLEIQFDLPYTVAAQ